MQRSCDGQGGASRRSRSSGPGRPTSAREAAAYTPRESSYGINRKKFVQKTQHENMGIAIRLERARSCGQGPQQKAVPAGWTRGVGGRLMPPPKMRWGEGPKYDAGAWNS